MMKVVYTASLSLTLGTPFMGLLCKHLGDWVWEYLTTIVCVYLASYLFIFSVMNILGEQCHETQRSLNFVYFLIERCSFFSSNLCFPVLLFPDSWPTNRPFVSTQGFICLLLHQIDDLGHLLCPLGRFLFNTIFEAILVIICFWLT